LNRERKKTKTWINRDISALYRLHPLRSWSRPAGTDDSKQEIIFLLPDTIATKTYDLSKGELGLLSITYVTKDGVPTYPKTGTLKITKYNRATKEFAGTFDFEAASLADTDNVSVTNGKFDVKYEGAK
jgi:hypothetical protein